MNPNTLKMRLHAGKVCINAWLLIPSTFSCEAVARAPWDSATIDLQHGLQDYLSAAHLIQTLQAASVTPIVRVPWNEPGIIGRALDAGAWGIICPMINSAADAESFARACLYPPAGSRSFGPIRARFYGGERPYHEIANDEILVLPQIETREALDNLDAILDVPGISGFYVGPSDLGQSLGLKPILDREEPEILDIYRRLIAAAAARGQIAGIHNLAPQYAGRMAELGFRFLTVGSDLLFIGMGSTNAVDSFRKSTVGLRANRWE
jgi:4-hydroxy-2-oxoheptanedioate aldolase